MKFDSEASCLKKCCIVRMTIVLIIDQAMHLWFRLRCTRVKKTSKLAQVCYKDLIQTWHTTVMYTCEEKLSQHIHRLSKI